MLLALGSQCCYTDLLHLLPTRTEPKSPFLPCRNHWLEIWGFTSHNQSLKRLRSQYPPVTKGAGSRWCPALFGAQWNQEIWAQLGCGRNQKLILQPVNTVLWWAGILHLQPVLGLGEFQGELPINQISNWLSRSSSYLCLFFFFFLPSRKAYLHHSCLSESPSSRGSWKIRVLQPPLGLKHRFTLGRTHTCSEPVLPSSSETQNSAAKARPTHSR